MKNKYLAAGLAGSLILGSTLPAWADGTTVSLPENSQWKPTVGHSAEGNFTKADQIVFNQQATQGRLEQFCRNIQLAGNIKASLPSSDGDISLSLLRRFVTLPSVDNPQVLELYKVDAYTPGIDLTPTINLASRNDAALGLGIGVSFNLASTVVRPQAFFSNCEKALELFNLKDVKVVLTPNLLKHPTKEKFIEEMTPRIQAMEDGELWQLSGNTTISAAPEVGATAGHISAGVSIGGTQNGNAVMIVHKLSRTHTRFSLRVSHLHVFNVTGTVADIPVINIFTPGGSVTLKNELEKVFNSAVAGKLVDYFTASFSVLQQVGDQSSQQYLIAFDLDTSDPAQVAELAEMMQYDFVELLRKAASMATLQATQKATLENFETLTAKHTAVYDRAANVMLTDVATIDGNHSVSLKIPVVGTHSLGSDSSRDVVYTVNSDAGTRELHLASAERPKNFQGLSIPVIDKTIISNNLNTKYTGFYFSDNGQLQVVLSHLDAFQQRAAGDVQGTLNEYRDMLSIAGSHGDPAADRDPKQFQITLPERSRDMLKSGSLAFTLNINAAGVDRAFHASAQEIQRAAERVFPYDNDASRSVVARITAALVQGKDATPAERNAALRELMVSEGNSNAFLDAAGAVKGTIGDTASLLLDHVPLVRYVTTPVLGTLTHLGEEDIAYKDMMKVLLQLVDPSDVSANLAMKIDAGEKHVKNTGLNLSVNQNTANPDLVAAGRANQQRTLQPAYMDIMDVPNTDSSRANAPHN